MITNQISITSVAPLYSEEYVLTTLFGRLKEVCPALPEERYEELLCLLFEAESLSDLIDQETFIEFYEMQPAVDHFELATLADRVKPILDQLKVSQDAKFIVRNVINTVPRNVDDLVDYITEDLLLEINVSYMMHLDLPIGEAPEGKLYTEKLKEVDDDDKHISGLIAMEMFQEGDGCNIEKLPGVTERQKMLSRAAQFWVLSQYGYYTASLWLAKFVDPLNFCHCTCLDCKSRHFGFADPQGCADLVFKHLDEIIKSIEESDNSITFKKCASVSEINSSNIELCLSAAESLLFVDQRREDNKKIAALLILVLNNIKLTKEIVRIKAIFVVDVFERLYGKGSFQQYLPEGLTMSELRVSSAVKLRKYLADESNDFYADRNHFLLHDASNFLAAHVQTYGGSMESIEFQSRFTESYYSPIEFLKFSQLIKLELKTKYEILVNGGIELYEGFLSNFTAMLTLKTIINGPHGDAIASMINEFNLEEYSNRKNLKFLSESGVFNAMVLRKELSSSGYQKQYWEHRINSHPNNQLK